jgi:transcriptional regulator with XRE-family HTH domain
LKTLGDHLRKKRLDLGLLQREAALQLGVDVKTVTNWERQRTEPKIRFLPAIFRFLGSDPRPLPATFREPAAGREDGSGAQPEGTGSAPGDRHECGWAVGGGEGAAAEQETLETSSTRATLKP